MTLNILLFPESPVKIIPEWECRKYKVKKGEVYYLSYKLYETDKVTSLNYKVEQVQSITSVKIVEKPYSKNYYIWGNSGITWNSGKYRLYSKYWW